MRTELILVGLLLLSLSTTAAAAENSTLRVIGAGTVEVPADTVIISVSAQSMDDNSTIAAENNSALLNKTKDALIAAGDYIPAGMAEVTAYVSVTYEVN